MAQDPVKAKYVQPIFPQAAPQVAEEKAQPSQMLTSNEAKMDIVKRTLAAIRQREHKQKGVTFAPQPRQVVAPVAPKPVFKKVPHVMPV